MNKQKFPKGKNLNKIQICIYLAFIAIVINGCKKDNNPISNPDNSKSTAVFNISKTYGTMTDQNGNVYKTIVIGSQTWMAENLRTTKYRNGIDIKEVTSKEEWSTLDIGAYCNYNNTQNIDTIVTYGRLYNWLALIDNRNIAPKGWHIPSDEEWKILVSFLGGEDLAGDKMKESGITHWANPNQNKNESGLTILPGGCRDGGGSFKFMGSRGDYWSCTMHGTYVLFRSFDYQFASSYSWECIKENGLYVRCVKD
jgi:uncharacterized protein (TIGR02145 family)